MNIEVNPEDNLHIQEQIQKIRARIDAACIRASRDPSEVRLMLVTKTVPVERIQYALNAGQMLIGENKVQEALQKLDLIEHHPGLDYQFIGSLQTNKVKDVLRFATCVQSVDRMRLARALDQQLQKEGRILDILIQVNTSYEESKFGVTPEEAIPLIKEVADIKTLNIKGLMTIGLFSEDEEKVRACFRKLKQIQLEVQSLALPGVQMDVLSMGMSGDLDIAIEEGSTMIRVGTAIFGQRDYSA